MKTYSAFSLFTLLASASALAQTMTPFELMVADYGTLSTVAGKGEVSNVGRVVWTPDMEGGDPRAAELGVPHMTMADARGRVYIADKENHAVVRVSADGETITTVAGSRTFTGTDNDSLTPALQVPLRNPNGLYVLPDGTFYILDLENAKIRRVGTDGMCRTILTDPSPQGFGFGRGLWVSQAEDLIYYAAGTEVRKWTEAGGIEVVASGFRELGNLTVDPGGKLVVTDRKSHRVFRIGDDGSKVVIAGSGAEGGGGSGMPATSVGLQEVRGIAFRPDGTYFLACMKRAAIWWVDLEGKVHLFIKGAKTGDARTGDGAGPTENPTIDKMAEPRSITIAPNGDLLITTNDQGFIRRVEAVRRSPRAAGVGFSRNGDGFQVNWQPEFGANYFVEETASLETPSWSEKGIVGWEKAALLLENDGQSGFYRVRTAH